MKKKWIPGYAIKWLLLVLTYNNLVYFGSRLLTNGRIHYDISIGLDNKIPFLPWMMVFYWSCYLFWGINYILSVREDEDTARRFALSDMLGKTVCLIFYIALPTTMQRPEVSGNGVWESIIRLLYEVDAADNLFPSIHCFVSWMSYLGIRKTGRIPKWYKIFSLVYALLVCLSTVTVKQHVILDVFAGVLLAEATYYICHHIKRRE